MKTRTTTHRRAVTFGVPAVLLVLLVLSACAMGGDEAASSDPAAPVVETFSTSAGVNRIATSEPNVVPEGDARDPWMGADAWVTAVQKGQEYIAEHPEPQNVQVLKGMTTAEVWSYMVQHVSGSLGVSCQYCHDINNYAADPYPQKISARLMMLMVNELNGQFVSQVPAWGGRYVTCATCHNGEPQGMLAYSEQNGVVPQNASGAQLETFKIDTYAVAPDYNAISTHPNTGKMLEMVNYLDANWSRFVLPRTEPIPEMVFDDRRNYLDFDGTIYAGVGCYTCHQGVQVPTGAVSKYEMLNLPDQGYIQMPPRTRGIIPTELVNLSNEELAALDLTARDLTDGERAALEEQLAELAELEAQQEVFRRETNGLSFNQ